MRAHQEHFEQIRNAELAETQRLEEAEKRRSQEKERRVQQEKERVAREQQVTEKVAARTFTKGFLAELQSSVVSNLQDAGFFYDPLEEEVNSEFMPWLMDSMNTQLDLLQVARAIADDMITAASSSKATAAEEAARLQAIVKERLDKEEAEKTAKLEAMRAEEEAAAAAAAAAAEEAAAAAAAAEEPVEAA